MIELLRNCSHGSEIATYLVTDAQHRVIRKTAWTPEGIATLKAEEQGWAWYCALRQDAKRFCRSQERPGCFAIDIDWIEGKRGNFAKGLIPNAELIQSAVDHYLTVWKDASMESAPMHGDFSVDNLIMNQDGIHVIDWEHFHPSAAPWGFDAFHLLFETLWFGIRDKRAPNPKEMSLLAKIFDTLANSGKTTEAFRHSPLSATVRFIRDNAALWRNQLQAFPGKLPVLSYSEKQVKMIDEWILNYRKRL